MFGEFNENLIKVESPCGVEKNFKLEMCINLFCRPESFNMNISHQLFYYKITFVNSQHENTNSKSDFVQKTGLKCSFLRFLAYKINLTHIWYEEFNY